jgi:hypothetical protein
VAGRWEWSLLLAAGAIGAVAFTDLIDFGVYHLRYTILNASSASSWSHAVAAGALLVGAAVCLAGAWRLPRQRAAWVATAAILALFFIDEVSGLHAQIDALSHGKLLYAPILLVLVLCVWRLMIGSTHLACLRAAAALLLGSYLIHVLGPHSIARELGWSPDGWAYQVAVVLKEGMELAGLLLALLALWGTAFAEKGKRGRRSRLEGPLELTRGRSPESARDERPTNFAP